MRSGSILLFAASGVLLFTQVFPSSVLPAPPDPLVAEKKEEPNIDDEYIAALEKLKEEDGRENAIIHYYRAQELAPRSRMDVSWQLVREVRNHGWSEKAKPLLHYVELWQPALDEIRRGAEIGYARQVVLTSERGVALPGFFELLMSADMLTVEARYFESRAEYGKAIRNYLAVIKMGRDFTQPDTTLLNNLIGISAVNFTVGPFQNLVESGKLKRESLRNVVSEIKKVEETWRPIREGFLHEYELTQADLEADLKYLRHAVTNQEREEELPLLEEAVKEPERIVDEVATLGRFELRAAEIPYPDFNREEYLAERKRLTEGFHPYVLKHYPLWTATEARVRYLLLVAQLRLVRLAAAVALYRLDHDAALRSLDQLVPKYLDSVPIDPFTGKPLRYRPWSDEGGGAIYSLGPDREDDRMKIEYDGTNGTFSKGDVFYEHR